MDGTQKIIVHIGFVGFKHSQGFTRILDDNGFLLDPCRSNRTWMVESVVTLFGGVCGYGDLNLMNHQQFYKSKDCCSENTKLSFCTTQEDPMCKVSVSGNSYFLLAKNGLEPKPDHFVVYMPPCFFTSPDFTYFSQVPSGLADLIIHFS
jgi:hypothetical protein